LSGCDSRRSLAGRLKIFIEQVTVATFDSRIANASDDLGCGVTPRGENRSAWGGVPRAELDCCLPSRRRAGVRWRTTFLSRAKRYHSRFSNSQCFLILFC